MKTFSSNQDSSHLLVNLDKPLSLFFLLDIPNQKRNSVPMYSVESHAWCRKWDSNPHCSGSKPVVSCRWTIAAFSLTPVRLDGEISLKVPHGHLQPPAVHPHCWNGFSYLPPRHLCASNRKHALPVSRVFQLAGNSPSYPHPCIGFITTG